MKFPHEDIRVAFLLMEKWFVCLCVCRNIAKWCRLVLGKYYTQSSRGGLEVEVWTDNSLHSASVGSNQLGSSCVDSVNKKEGSMQSGLVAV